MTTTEAAEVRTEYRVVFKRNGEEMEAGPHPESIANQLADLWRGEAYGYTDIEVQFRHIEISEWEKA